MAGAQCPAGQGHSLLPNEPVRLGDRNCQVTEPTEKVGVEWTACEVRVGRAGDQIHIVHGRDGGWPVLSVSDVRRNGAIVSFAVNGKAYEHTFSGLYVYMQQQPPSFDKLPLSVEQLIAVTTDPRLSL